MNIKRFGKVAAALTTLVVGLSLAGSALALTQSDIAMLQAAGIITPAQAASLSASITPVVTPCTVVFTQQLTIGSTGVQVVAVQQKLVAEGFLVMPAGVSFGYFGSLTRAAVIKFQLAHSIDAVLSALSAGAGQVGPYTRAYLNANCGSAPVVVVPGQPVFPVGSTLNVTLAATSPASSAVIAGQAAADIAEFKFTNTSSVPAVVTNVTLHRDGISADAAFANVYLYNGAVRLTDSASVVSGTITFNAGSGLFTVAPGASVTIAVKADIAGTAGAGQIINVYLTNVTSNVPVAASYPVFGASFTVAVVNDLAKATSTVNTALSGGTVQVGSINQTLWSSALTISGRPVWFKSLGLKFIGSANYNAIQNISLYASGVKIGTASGVDANGMITFDLTAAPYKIDSSRTIEVRADVVSGSSRTFSLNLQNSADIQLVDSNYNVAITVGLINNSGTWTINGATGGFVTFATDNSFSGDNVIAGATNVTIAKYTLKAYGEAEKISSLVASTSVSLDNVSLYADGLLLASGNTTAGVGHAFNLGSSLIIPAGGTVTLSLRADITTNGTNVATNTAIIAAVSGATNNTQGQESSQLSTTPSLVSFPLGVNGPTMTVSAAGLTLTANPGTLLAVPNTNGVKIGSYTVSAGSSEDIRITNINVTLGGAAGAVTNVSSLYIQPRNGTASTIIGAPTASNNFNTDFTVVKNGSQIVDVFANLGNATGTASTTMTVYGYGLSSNSSVSVGPTTGQSVSVGLGSITSARIQTGSGFSPVAQFVVGGTTAPLAVYNFVSTNGDSVIKEMYFTVTGGVDWVTVNGVTVPVVSGGATTTSSTGLATVAQGYAGANVSVGATYSTVGIGGSISGDVIPTSITLTGIKYTSGSVTTSSTTAQSSATMTLVATKPAASVASDSNTGNGTKILAHVTVSADSHGPINLLTLPLSITRTGSTTASTTAVFVNGSPVTFLGGATNAATGSIAFSGSGYPISAGGSVTFDIYGVISAGVVNTDNVQTSLGNANFFTWTDINGNANASGTAMYNYPTNSAIVNI